MFWPPEEIQNTDEIQMIENAKSLDKDYSFSDQDIESNLESPEPVNEIESKLKNPERMNKIIESDDQYFEAIVHNKDLFKNIEFVDGWIEDIENYLKSKKDSTYQNMNPTIIKNYEDEIKKRFYYLWYLLTVAYDYMANNNDNKFNNLGPMGAKFTRKNDHKFDQLHRIVLQDFDHNNKTVQETVFLKNMLIKDLHSHHLNQFHTPQRGGKRKYRHCKSTAKKHRKQPLGMRVTLRSRRRATKRRKTTHQ